MHQFVSQQLQREVALPGRGPGDDSPAIDQRKDSLAAIDRAVPMPIPDVPPVKPVCPSDPSSTSRSSPNVYATLLSANLAKVAYTLQYRKGRDPSSTPFGAARRGVDGSEKAQLSSEVPGVLLRVAMSVSIASRPAASGSGSRWIWASRRPPSSAAGRAKLSWRGSASGTS